jgi:hypothetical protein
VGVEFGQAAGVTDKAAKSYRCGMRPTNGEAQ